MFWLKTQYSIEVAPPWYSSSRFPEICRSLLTRWCLRWVTAGAVWNISALFHLEIKRLISSSYKIISVTTSVPVRPLVMFPYLYELCFVYLLCPVPLNGVLSCIFSVFICVCVFNGMYIFWVSQMDQSEKKTRLMSCNCVLWQQRLLIWKPLVPKPACNKTSLTLVTWTHNAHICPPNFSRDPLVVCW